MPDKPNGKRWGWRNAVWIGVLMPLIYVLSVGPVSCVCWHTSEYQSSLLKGWLFRVYRPLVFLAYRPAFGRPLAAYLNMWVRRDYVPYADYAEGFGLITATGLGAPPSSGCFDD